MPLSIVFFLPLLVSGFGHSLLFPANLFLPKLDGDAEILARVQYLLVFFVVLTVLAEIQIRSVEWQHLVKYGPSVVRATARLYRITRWLLGPLLALQMAIFGVLLYDAWSRPDVIWAAMAAAGVATLWFMMFGFAWLKILMGTGISSRSPDVALVRILADAYSAVVAGGSGISGVSLGEARSPCVSVRPPFYWRARWYGCLPATIARLRQSCGRR